MRRTLCSVLLVASLLAGCSADSDDSSGSPTTSSTAARGSSTASTAPTTPSTPPTTSGGIEPVRRAIAVCGTVAGRDPAHATVLSSAPSDAAAVEAELTALGATAAPWDTLPPDHFVAVCTFGAAPTTAAQTPATVACPDGAVVLDVAVQANYVDEDGRTSDASAVYEPDPCVAPTPLP